MADEAQKVIMRRKFVPHRTHIGPLDYMLGIDMFWSEKVIIFLQYGQRLALLLLWDLDWPDLFYRRMNFMYAFLLDLTAHHENVAPLGAGTPFEGCEIICKLVWPTFSMLVLGLWAGLTLLDNTPLYYTRNFERILWMLVRIGWLPYLNTLIRYLILNEDGNLTTRTQEIVTPVSQVGGFLAIVTVLTFTIVGYIRSAKQVLFKSTIRHDAFMRARELEYMLRFSTMYRNERLWMIASYNFEAWPWSIVRAILDALLLVNMTFVPRTWAVFFGTILLFLTACFGIFFADIHRCWSSNVLEHISNVTLTIFCIFGILQVNGVRNALLVDSNLDYFLFGLHAFAGFLFILASFTFFVDGHILGIFRSAAEKRARAKWKKVFVGEDGDIELANEEVKPDANEDDDEENARIDAEAFVKEMQAAEDFDKKQAKHKELNFYIPRQREFMDIDTASPHVWPVNAVIVNELLRRNTNDHLVDVLRAARRMLDRISALHNTPVLIPTDELKTHITRLQKCHDICKRQRITHHANAIHPLQTTFEDLIEQFTYELRVFSGRSVTEGHNARKMIEVSRYLRRRMDERDRTLALISPMMRRVLMKLFTLRVFIELVEDRPEYLMPKNIERPFHEEDLAPDSDDDSADQQSPFKGHDVFGADADADAIGAFQRGDEGLDDDDDSVGEHQANLADLLKAKRDGGDDDDDDAQTASSSAPRSHGGLEL